MAKLTEDSIGAIGIVILADQLIPETGLAKLASHEVSHGSTWAKFAFVIGNIKSAHGATCGIAFGSFAIIMVCR